MSVSAVPPPTAILAGFDSQHSGHVLQPDEVRLLGALILIFQVVNSRLPTLAELQTIWSGYVK